MAQRLKWVFDMPQGTKAIARQGENYDECSLWMVDQKNIVWGRTKARV